MAGNCLQVTNIKTNLKLKFQELPEPLLLETIWWFIQTEQMRVNLLREQFLKIFKIGGDVLIISCTMQKKEDNLNTLKVSININGECKATSDTYAAYGVATAATRK